MAARAPVFVLVVCGLQAAAAIVFQDGETWKTKFKTNDKDEKPVMGNPSHTTHGDDDFGSPKVGKAELSETWGYASNNGPSTWGGNCKGTDQSPINIDTSVMIITQEQKDYVNLNYIASKGLGVENDGHTIVGTGDALEFHKITQGGADYMLKRFVFRRPSEHTINGKQFVLEAQLQHESSEGAKLVLSVLFNEGTENAFLRQLNWKHLPKSKGAGNGITSDLKMNDLIPGYNQHNFFRYYMYTGSSTTPPCDASVKWVVAKHSAEISTEQLSKFPFAHNARPVQPRGQRKIYEDAGFTPAPTVGPTTRPTRAPSGMPSVPPTTATQAWHDIDKMTTQPTSAPSPPPSFKPSPQPTAATGFPTTECGSWYSNEC